MEQYLPTYTGCMVCGQPEHNPNTLNVRFQVTDKGVEVPFTAKPVHQGYENIVHGGIITALLDETIGWAVAVSRKKFFLTGELTMRFVRSLPVGLPVTVKGWPVEHKSRYSIAEGEIVDAEGTVYAKASGKFFLIKDGDADRVNSYLTFQDGDLDVLAE